ncbi:protealysin inhibitor emfourin [Mucilaginibacter rubeus]|uniref:Uncharacterized protein n=1 Tax=Mucilaginibacter rubeus TaxID=2027860 RepID=A0A5C1HZL5_9SPHI|nr:protealysin inhibitor emfourin [Mucilaginibacter rubeus]QEM11019.1 hypothetical protein DEO27_013640 [Mucilaginibacter rubeus]
MTLLKVERIGGLAGFGITNSRIKSVGEIDMNQLTDDDKQAVNNLFTKKSSSASPQSPDTFLYKISRTTGEGVESIETTEDLVPTSIKDSVRDELV